MGIGTRIKELRRRMGMTQPELAERLGVHETTIRRWELERDRGPDGKAIGLLANVLHTAPEYLLNGENNEPSHNVDLFTENPQHSESTRLIYEWGGNHRLSLPNTPETRLMFTELVSQAMSGKGEPVITPA